MGLFNKFKDTIIYKDDSELENKISILKELSERYPNNDKIKKDLKFAELGLQGEKNIEFELKNANIGMYVLHDITLRYEDLTAQIDFIVVTPAKIYFIECKNLWGDITVNNRGEFKRKYEYYGHKVEEGFYSPLSQAERHINIYKKYWHENRSKLAQFLFGKNIDMWYVPLVVMANSKNILNVKFAPKEIKNKIVRADQLEKYIKNDIKNTKKGYLSTKKEMEEIAHSFLELNTPNEIDYEKIYLTENDKTNQLTTKLKEFRTIKAKDRNIPEDYIFTDEELNVILEKLPKTMEELKDVLSEIKQKLHGQEIIDIVNEIIN